MRWRDFIKHLEDLCFHAPIFYDCFNYKRSFFERREIGRTANAADDRLLARGVEPLLVYVSLQTLVDRPYSTIEKLVADVVHDHVVTGAGCDLGYAVTHRARTDYANYSVLFTHEALFSEIALDRICRMKTGFTKYPVHFERIM